MSGKRRGREEGSGGGGEGKRTGEDEEEEEPRGRLHGVSTCPYVPLCLRPALGRCVCHLWAQQRAAVVTRSSCAVFNGAGTSAVLVSPVRGVCGFPRP